MILFAKAYQSNGRTFATLEAAQEAELVDLLADHLPPNLESRNEVTRAIVTNKDKVVDILTLTDKSRPRARKANGATKKRTKNLAAAQNAALQDQDA